MSDNVEEGSILKIGHWNSKTDRRCEDCDMNFFDINEFNHHMAWHKHGNYQGNHYCEACDIYANCQKNYDLHLNGEKHKRKEMKKLRKDNPNLVKEMKNLRKSNPNLFKYYCKANPNMYKYYCEVCNVYANCQKTYDSHLNGRKHKENIRKSNEKNEK